MTLKKYEWNIGMILIFGIMLSGFASGLGITPAITNVDYFEDFEYFGQFKIVNTQGYPVDVNIKINGNLASYVKMDNQLIHLEGNEKRNVQYKLKLPNGIVKPGNNDLIFVATETLDDSLKGTYLGASFSLVTTLSIKVPYAEKYLETSFRVKESDVSDSTIFIIEATNAGSKQINNIFADIDIKDNNGKVIDSLKTDSISIKAGESKNILIPWTKGVLGDYVAEITVNYDNEKNKMEENFRVEGVRLDIQNIAVNNFKLGEVAKFEINLKNLWNENLEVEGDVKIYDAYESLIGNFKTSKENIMPNTVEFLVGYWNTKDVDVGAYTANITLNFYDKHFEKGAYVDVANDGIKIKINDEENINNSKFNSVFLIVVFILIVTNILWFAYFREK
ncbi:MAG: hypothetical protein Q8Q42_04005 [Nanoarchaeota archaeon]|nr:hypothetical protein [Nanoarchaeota archaeon]